ncbi:SWIM zinc finger family protein [Methanoplanus endosymbiosus]|uniref:SWIM zinc finger family protein n=1 Tax=Methanoplanus endosymbiosus TaxID=33865 RepID=A0A9E7PP55_9EURY|nr:SWIM zinc finger family protein [Methanoplanus endosymbiosus]UUX92316.1 SWIM zinc finger family protein [Methanoplanus endosymbiosus]
MSWYYTPSKPYGVKGGLIAKSKRGDIGTSWWSQGIQKGFLPHSYDSYISRGKNYARKGQVISVKIDEGKITGYVQGSDRTPYKVTVDFDYADENSGHEKALVEYLNENYTLFLRMLSGDLTENFNRDIKKNTGFTLVPDSRFSLSTWCSCPVGSDICKHTLAVLFILSEQLDEDPMILFTLAGMDKERVIGEVRDLQYRGEIADEESEFTENLPCSEGTFWHMGDNLKKAGYFDPGDEPGVLTSVSESVYKALMEDSSPYDGTGQIFGDVDKLRGKAMKRAALLLRSSEYYDELLSGLPLFDED